MNTNTNILLFYIFVFLVLFIASIILLNKCKLNTNKRRNCHNAFFVGGVIGAVLFGLALLSTLFVFIDELFN